MALTSKQIELFAEITQINAIAGHERHVAKVLKKKYEELGLSIVTDNLGSIFAVKKSKMANAPKVMVAGHMDEVGFIVVGIQKNGMLKADAVGGINPQTLLAHRLLLTTKDGKQLNGSIDAVPPHLMSESDRNSITKINSMLFDFGFKSKEEAENAGVYHGAQIVVDGPFVVLNDGQRLLAKAFDNRYGVVLGLDLLETLKDVDLGVDLYVGATVQEEVGTRGAQTATHLINPDFAIVLDCSPARDSTGEPLELGQLGKGFLIRFFDRSMIAFPELLDFQKASADKVGAPYQMFDSPGGTDAGAIHRSFDGVLTLTHCICARNIHTCSSIIDVNDYLAAKATLIEMLKSISHENIKNWREARH